VPAPLNNQERFAPHRGIFETFLRRAQRGQARIRIPRQMELYRRKPGAHFHPTPEIFFQTGGATDFCCPGGNFRLGTGNICVMPRGVSHGEKPVNLSTPYSILVCCFRPDGAILIRAHSPGNNIIRGSSADHLVGHRSRDAFEYLDRISAWENIPKNYQAIYIRTFFEAYVLSVLSDLVRPEQAKKGPPPLVEEAANLVRGHLADMSLSVAGIAKTLRCSPDHLSRLFQRHHGKTLAAWIVSERLEMAKELLKNSRHTVAEIGWACGFNAPSYFIRVFKEHWGVTPRAFRSMHA
jgi:AraC-like DNA-binding protein